MNVGTTGIPWSPMNKFDKIRDSTFDSVLAQRFVLSASPMHAAAMLDVKSL
jgi:hypothetical protein